MVSLGEDNIVYHIGIIDWLQTYSFRKFLETLLKALYLLWNWTKISCVPPNMYARRFMQFMTSYSC